MALRALLVLSLLVVGCGGLPEPKITDVTPAEVNAAALTPIAITLDAVLPTSVDYGKGEITADSQVTVFVDQTEIGTTRIDAAGVVRALVPPNLPSGQHDVRVELRDRRAAVAAGALTVVR